MAHEEPNLEFQMHRHRILSTEREEIIEQIRKIDGFGNFLKIVPFSTLQRAAAAGPVILINISNYRSDALIIQIDKPPTLVTLPNVTPKQLILLREQLDLARNQPMTESSKLICSILRDLWNDIVSPVVNCLTQLAVPPRSRIWWCPTSTSCILPLHTAGLYQAKQSNFNLPDIYTSSYISTLSALTSARSNMIGSTVPKLLVIGQPKILPVVQKEIDYIQGLSDFASVNVLMNADASRDTVLDRLQEHSWVHFACHGHLGDNSQPFHGSFELDDDDRITLLDLIKARLPNAELAFLSVCGSAAGDPNTPDETIHLAAALQFCGFRSVVQW
jgi:CHAT domain-containing protein